MYYDIGADDKLYSEFREMCKEALIGKVNYLCIDMTKNKKEGKYLIFNQSKNKFIGCVSEIEFF